MGFKHLAAAYRTETGSASRRAVLCALAFRACDSCGLCWPGVAWIVGATEVSERGVQGALAELARDGHVAGRRYSRGGRGVSTEYVVLPSLAKLSTAPCGECAERMKTPQPLQGFPAANSRKPRKSSRETPQDRTHHHTENLYQSGAALPPNVESSLALAPLSDPPTSIPPEARSALVALDLLTDASEHQPPSEGERREPRANEDA